MLGADPLWNIGQGRVYGAFRVGCVLVHLSLGHEENRCEQSIDATGECILDDGG